MDRREEVYRKLYKTGNWYWFPSPLLNHLTMNQASMVAVLMHYHQHEDWFEYNIREVWWMLGFDEEKQRRLLRILKEKRLVETKTVDRKRYAKLNNYEIEQLLED